MGRYNLKGTKTYKVRMTAEMQAQVYIEPHWVDFTAIEGLSELEANKSLDEHYMDLHKFGVSKEFIGRVEEFRQRYIRDKVHYVRDDANQQHSGI